MLLERAAGRDLTPSVTAVQSRTEPVQSDSDYPDYPPGYVFDPTKTASTAAKASTCPKDTKANIASTTKVWPWPSRRSSACWTSRVITRDPNPPKIDWHISSPSKEWVANNIDLVREEAAKFEEEIKLRIERQKAWPAIEERRRKKLAQIYPSHSEDEDSEPPDS